MCFLMFETPSHISPPFFDSYPRGGFGENWYKKHGREGIWIRIDKWRYNIPLERTRTLFVRVGEFDEGTGTCDWLLAKSSPFRSNWIFERIPGLDPNLFPILSGIRREYMFSAINICCQSKRLTKW